MTVTASDYSTTEWISGKRFESTLKKQERENIRRYGRSLTATSIGNRVRDCICEIRDGSYLVKSNWRDRIKGQGDPGTVITLNYVLNAVKSGPVRVPAGAILARTATALVEGYGLHFLQVGEEVIFASHQSELAGMLG